MTMGSSCCKVMGLLVLISGLSFLAYGLNMWNNGMQVHLVAGLFLTLYGLGKLAHSMNMCPTCSAMKEEKPSGKKR